MKDIKESLEDDTNVLAQGVKEEELVAVPTFKTVEFDGSLAEYFSEMLIEKGKKDADDKKGDVLIHTVKDQEDVNRYLGGVKSDKKYMETAVYVKQVDSVGGKVSMENDLNEFLYYLKTKEITPMLTEKEVQDFYKEVTNEES